MIRSARESRIVYPHSVSWLNKGKTLARRLCDIAMLSNSYSTLRRAFDKATEESFDGNLKDLVIGVLAACGTRFRQRFGATYTPLKYATPPPDVEPTVPRPGVGCRVEEATPLLLNPEQSTSLDLELGASAGVTPSVNVSPTGPPLNQRKADYEHRGFRIKRKPKSTVTKLSVPSMATTSTPAELPRDRTSEAAQSLPKEKTSFGNFKIPFKRRRTPSDVESSETDTSASVAPQPRATSLDSWVPTTVHAAVPEKRKRRGGESTESSHAIQQLKRQNEMLEKRLYEIERRNECGPRQTERRSDRFEQHSRVRNWHCFDRPRYPGGQSRGRRDRGVADNRWR